MARVLVVDDENLMRTMVEVACRRLGHEALCAATLAEGRRLAAAGVDVILLDMLLPDGNGLDAQQELAALPDAPDIVVITGHGDGDAAEKALRGGVWDFLMKPVRVRDVEETLSHVLEARDRRRSRRGLELEPGQVAGSGPAMQAALAQLEQAAHSDVNVLLLGETGVGKELFARTLYRNSHRASRPFVAVDCASLPETLVESHLFGHARGAFTGAERASEGLLRAAHQGTLFLDEVGDLPQGIQRAFLRALELRRFRPVGEVREVESDFRLVAATNRDLDDMVGMDLYRSDLRFRLRGMTIHVPPLRRRAEDIPLLAEHFTARYCQRHELPNKELTPDCYAMLADYSWPGNVRELSNALQKALVFNSGAPVSIRDLQLVLDSPAAHPPAAGLSINGNGDTGPAPGVRRSPVGTGNGFHEGEAPVEDAPAPAGVPHNDEQRSLASIVTACLRSGDPSPFDTCMDIMGRAVVREALRQCRGNRSQAARLLGLSRPTLLARMEKYGLKIETRISDE